MLFTRNTSKQTQLKGYNYSWIDMITFTKQHIKVDRPWKIISFEYHQIISKYVIGAGINVVVFLPFNCYPVKVLLKCPLIPTIVWCWLWDTKNELINVVCYPYVGFNQINCTMCRIYAMELTCISMSKHLSRLYLWHIYVNETSTSIELLCHFVFFKSRCKFNYQFQKNISLPFIAVVTL